MSWLRRWPPADWPVGGDRWNAALVVTMFVAVVGGLAAGAVVLPYAVGVRLVTGRWPA